MAHVQASSLQRRAKVGASPQTTNGSTYRKRLHHIAFAVLMTNKLINLAF